MEWLNFRHLYAFWMVGRKLSFTKAAEAMNVAQSAVSDQVAQLEDYLGEQLIIRSTRSLRLTPKGLETFEYAQAIFEKSRDINRFLRDKAHPASALNLKVGVIGGASRTFLYQMADRYLRAHPDSHVSVNTGSYEELYEQLKKLELDILISAEPPKKRDLEEFSFQKVGQSHLCLVGSKKLIRAIKSQRSQKRIDLFKFHHPYEIDLLDKYVRPLVQSEVRLRLSTDDIPLLRFFATSDRGLVIMPKIGVLEELQSGEVEAIELKKCPEVYIYGMFLRRTAQHKNIETFLS